MSAEASANGPLSVTPATKANEGSGAWFLSGAWLDHSLYGQFALSDWKSAFPECISTRFGL